MTRARELLLWLFRNRGFPLLSFVIIALTYPQLRRQVLRIARGSAGAFDQSSFIWGTLTTEPRVYWTVVPALVLAALTFRWGWDRLEEGKALRWVIFPVMITLTWFCAGTTYSLVFDQYYLVDRLVICGLGVATLWRPGLVPMAFCACYIQLGEQGAFLNALNFTDKAILTDCLLLFCYWLALRVLTKTRASVYLALLLGTIAAHYFAPLLMKIRISPVGHEWFLEDNLADLFIACHINGWLPGFEEGTILAIAAFFGKTTVAQCIIAGAIEGLALFIALNRKYAIVIIGASVALHFAILSASAIFFWKWIVVDVALIIMLMRAPGRALFAEMGLMRVGAVIIGFGGLSYWGAIGLGWWDTPMEQTLRFEVEGESGARYNVASSFFAPHDMRFAQGRLYNLYDKGRSVGTFSTTMRYKVFRELKAAKDPADAARILDRGPPTGFSVHETRRFDAYIQRFFTTLNHNDGKRPLSWLPRFPIHIQFHPKAPAYEGQEKVVRVHVRLVETFYDGQAIHELTNRVVRIVEVAPPSERGTPIRVEPCASPALRLVALPDTRLLQNAGRKLDYGAMLAPVTRLTAGADLAITALVQPPKTQKSARVADLVSSLASAGVDVVNVLALSSKRREAAHEAAELAGVTTVGTRPRLVEVGEGQVGFVACTNGALQNCASSRVHKNLEATRARAQVVAALVYLTTQREDTLVPWDRRAVLDLIEAGADLVIVSGTDNAQGVQLVTRASDQRRVPLLLSRGRMFGKVRTRDSRASPAVSFGLTSQGELQTFHWTPLDAQPGVLSAGDDATRDLLAQKLPLANAVSLEMLNQSGCEIDESVIYRGPIGASCTLADDCEDGLDCDLTAWGGMCTRPCTSDATCGASARCGRGRDRVRQCMATCTKTRDCNAGRICRKNRSTAPVCSSL